MATRKIPTVQVQVRDHVGSRDAARLRELGRLPAVIYGHKKNSVHVWLDLKQFTDLLHQHVHLLEVVINSTAEPCLIKKVQWDHLGSQVLHVDMTRVDLTERVTVNVGLELTGEAVGLKEAGALLEHPLSEITVECEAANIPTAVPVDISNLDVGNSITIGDIALPAGVSAVTEADTLIAVIRMLAEVPEEEPVVEGASTEPEVIGKKEQLDEGETT